MSAEDPMVWMQREIAAMSHEANLVRRHDFKMVELTWEGAERQCMAVACRPVVQLHATAPGGCACWGCRACWRGLAGE